MPDRCRDGDARSLKFSGQPVHVVDVIVWSLTVLRFLIVAAASGEIGGLRHVGSRQGTVRDAIAIYVFVAGKSAQALQFFLGQNFSTSDWLFRIVERIGHPIVHA